VSKNSVIYTGTHDNDTTVGWARGAGRSREQAQFEKDAAAKLLPEGASDFHWGLIELALSTPAQTAVIPVQDLLGLGSEARLNRPGTAEGNWTWRLSPGALGSDMASRFRRLVEKYGRLPVGANAPVP
jgi:4-alpha-glucanotransferase